MRPRQETRTFWNDVSSFKMHHSPRFDVELNLEVFTATYDKELCMCICIEVGMLKWSIKTNLIVSGLAQHKTSMSDVFTSTEAIRPFNVYRNAVFR